MNASQNGPALEMNQQFVEQLSRHLLRGRSLVRDVVEELHPQVHEFGMRMEDAAAVAQARERAS